MEDLPEKISNEHRTGSKVKQAPREGDFGFVPMKLGLENRAKIDSFCHNQAKYAL
jgi:hypothetical protein